MQGKLKQSYRVSIELGQNSTFSGSILLSQLSRLSSLVMPGEAEIVVSFEFAIALNKQPSIRGHIDARLDVQCQRCMGPMMNVIDLDFELLIDASDEDVQALNADTVYTESGYLDVFEVIEDELILALPLISLHEEITCNEFWQPETENVEEVVEKNNPFSVLESLKTKDKPN